jgi:hypothetical protein
MAALLDDIKKSLEKRDGKWNEKKGLWEYSATIAERKAFLAKKKLTYSLKFRIDDTAKVVKFSEMLMEAGSGFSSGGDMDGGFGIKTETYNTFGGARQGTITEQSKVFGKDYSYQFDYNEIRNKIQEIAEQAGYKFEYQVLPVK